MAWGRVDTIVIDHTKVASNESNFPYPLIKTDNNFKSIANSGYMANGSAYDIKFYSDAGLTTQIPSQRIFHNLTTGAVYYHIKIASISTSSDVTIYAAFGDASITTDQSDAANTYPASYKAFFLFGDGTTLSVNDSTSNAITGTNHSVTAGTGPYESATLGGAGVFNGSTQYIDLGNVLGITGDVTVTFWGKSTGWTVPYSKTSAGTGAAQPLSSNFSGAFNQARMIVGDGTTDTAHTIRTANTPPSNTWTFYSWQISGTSWTVRKNNTSDNSGSGLSQTRTDAAISMLLGLNGAGTEHYDGSLAALRFLNATVSTGWRDTEYASENSPSTFSSHTFSTPAAGSIPNKIYKYKQAVQRASFI